MPEHTKPVELYLGEAPDGTPIHWTVADADRVPVSGRVNGPRESAVRDLIERIASEAVAHAVATVRFDFDDHTARDVQDLGQHLHLEEKPTLVVVPDIVRFGTRVGPQGLAALRDIIDNRRVILRSYGARVGVLVGHTSRYHYEVGVLRNSQDVRLDGAGLRPGYHTLACKPPTFFR